jgi:hypothetical protein
VWCYCDKLVVPDPEFYPDGYTSFEELVMDFENFRTRFSDPDMV